MSWVRLDDGFMEHDKIVDLPPKLLAIHLRALCYAARRRDPHIASGALPLLVATKPAAERLTEAGLWDRNGNGWVIHDWHDYQGPMTAAERQAKRRRTSHGDTPNE